MMQGLKSNETRMMRVQLLVVLMRHVFSCAEEALATELAGECDSEHGGGSDGSSSDGSESESESDSSSESEQSESDSDCSSEDDGAAAADAGMDHAIATLTASVTETAGSTAANKRARGSHGYW
jgi:hypothetical protein